MSIFEVFRIPMLVLILAIPITGRAENCADKSINFVGRIDYARKVNNKIGFFSDYVSIKSPWNSNSGDFRKIYLTLDKKVFSDLTKAKFKSEYISNKKIVIEKQAAILEPTKESYHEIEKLNFYDDLLGKMKFGTGLLIIKFLYDEKEICTQEVMIESTK